MASVAQFGTEFPKAAQLPSKIGGVPTSPLDYALSILGHAGLGAASLFTKPLMRQVLASDLYQKHFVNPPTYGPSAGSQFMQGLQNGGGLAFTQPDARKRLAALLNGSP
jgi:hypothetical protein